MTNEEESAVSEMVNRHLTTIYNLEKENKEIKGKYKKLLQGLVEADFIPLDIKENFLKEIKDIS